MPIPAVNQTIQDSGLSGPSLAAAGTHLLMGLCSNGTPNQVYQFANPATMAAALGTGALVDCGAYELGIDGGPMYFVPINPSVTGSFGPVTLGGPNAAALSNNGGGTNTTMAYQPTSGSVANSSVTHTGTGTGSISIAGSPTVNALVLIQILSTGSNSTATYRYSLDGGVSWSGSQTLSASVTLNGLTLTVTGSSGAFVQGDYYYFTTVLHAPSGTPTITVTGSPVALPASSESPNTNPAGIYNVVVTMVLGGAVGTATFKYSLDGGVTTNSGTLTTAATVALPGTGLVLNFAAGTWVATDVYQFLAVATSGAGVGTVTPSGYVADAYQVQVKIFASGTSLAAGTASFQYSLDDGNTFSPVIAIPSAGTYLIPGTGTSVSTGITLTFANGVGNVAATPAFSAGDIYAFDCLGPGYTSTDLNNAITAAFAQRNASFNWIHVVGAPSTASGLATMASTASSAVDSQAVNNNRYVFVIMDGADDADANYISAFANFVDYRVCVTAGYDWTQSNLNGRQYKRPAGWALSARLGATTEEVDPARFSDGPLLGVTALLRDEIVTPGLDAARFTTLRTFLNVAGFFVTNGNMMEKTGGNFTLVQYVRVLNLVCTIAFQAQRQYLSSSVRVNTSTVAAPLVPGAIDPRDAAGIQNAINSLLKQYVVQPIKATDVQVTIDQTVAISTTSTLVDTIAITPLGYIKTINSTIGFSNPALAI